MTHAPRDARSGDADFGNPRGGHQGSGEAAPRDDAREAGASAALEQSLRRLSAPPVGEPTLWRAALESVAESDSDGSSTRTLEFKPARRDRGRSADELNRAVPRWIWGVCAAAVIVIVGGAMLPLLGRARSGVGGRYEHVAVENMKAALPPPNATPAYGTGGPGGHSFDRAEAPPSAGSAGNFASSAAESDQIALAPSSPVSVAADMAPAPASTAMRESGARTMASGRSAPTGGVDAPEVIERAVVRKASMRLRVPEVRLAFARVQDIASESRGEYVQDAQLTGEGEKAVATITLRVAATRLSQAMNDLRTLGVVADESVRADDVTDQMVDLEARLKNERNVEAELANLLKTRSNSRLSEVLELRTSLNNVRQSIERLTAQRDRLGRLVALSSIQVSLEHESAERRGYATAPTLTDDLTSTLRKAFRSAVRGLIDSVGLIITVAIGGAIVWIPLIIAAVIFLRRRKGRVARGRVSALEPPPTLDA